ncbi:MAG: hypothetical protein U5K76_12725 [Woeseiaceae bacterium]|nr:hypothetical protein [Woeseiaceae bacterium]
MAAQNAFGARYKWIDRYSNGLSRPREIRLIECPSCGKGILKIKDTMQFFETADSEKAQVATKHGFQFGSNTGTVALWRAILVMTLCRAREQALLKKILGMTSVANLNWNTSSTSCRNTLSPIFGHSKVTEKVPDIVGDEIGWFLCGLVGRHRTSGGEPPQDIRLNTC